MMRLTCPNCDAQYEVPDNVVPPEGRDVQCSNCGQTWFQHHADHIPEEDTSALAEDTIAVDEETEAPEPEPEPEVEEAAVTQPPPPRAENKGLDDLDDLTEPAPRSVPKRKELDPDVAEILRQEAEAEQEARGKRTSDPLESQPDLGLPDTDSDDADDSDRRTLEARQRMARLRGEPEPMSDADVNAAAISSRRDLLPDIDEINSTLRTENDRNTGANGQPEIDAPTTKKRKRSFRRGFFMMLLLFAVLAVIYVYATQMAQAVPQLDPVLTAYVGWVDQMRQWLDGHVQNLLRWLDTMASQSGS